MIENKLKYQFLHIKVSIFVCTFLSLNLNASETRQELGILTFLNQFSLCGRQNQSVIPYKPVAASTLDERQYASKGEQGGKPIPFEIPERLVDENSASLITSDYTPSSIVILKLQSTSIYQQSTPEFMEVYDFKSTQRLVITDAITDDFFAELTKFKNIEELVFENFENITELPINHLCTLRKLRRLELRKVSIYQRRAGYNLCDGVKSHDLNDLLKRLSLTHLTIQTSDLAEIDANTLQTDAIKKNITLNLLSSIK
jgi:hypothetical protein